MARNYVSRTVNAWTRRGRRAASSVPPAGDGERLPVTVSLRYVDGEGGGRVEVAIRDDGPGIPVAEREALREGRETQLDHGSGLGLWLVKWTTTAVGGTISFEDREPRGTVFRCSFPP